MLTRYPPGLASALRKISADTEPLEAANKATAHLYIVNPLKDIKGAVNSLFSTHPPIDERIARLEKMSAGKRNRLSVSLRAERGDAFRCHCEASGPWQSQQ